MSAPAAQIIAKNAIWLATQAASDAAVRIEYDEQRALEEIDQAIIDLERARVALRGW